MKLSYYNVLVSICKDLQGRVNRGGGINEIAVEELIVKKKYARQSTLSIVITHRIGGGLIGVLAKESTWWLKHDFYNELKESLCQRIIHNYFVFGLGKTFRDGNYQYLSKEEKEKLNRVTEAGNKIKNNGYDT